MKAIFGYISRSGQPLPPFTLKTMHDATIACGGDKCNFIENSYIGMGWAPDVGSTRSADCSSYKQSTDHVTFIAAGRVDNSSELGKLLVIPESELLSLSDQELIKRAYLKWGEDCSKRIYGDWAYAAWHPTERKLSLSRDHHGHTSLYYYIDENIFAFASFRPAILALKLAPVELDELYLAQYLMSYMTYQGEQTLHHPIRRLPPAHTLIVSLNNLTINRYWKLEDTPEIYLSSREDYVEAFRHLFDEAVRCRLRSNGHIASTLSGGLDSSSVSVTAAHLLKATSQRLISYTSVPYFETSCYLKSRFGNEFPFAQASASLSGNIDLYPLTSIGITPITAIRRVLESKCDPCHSACNMYWLLDIMQSAKARGCSVLLTGGHGNGSISWEGDIFSQPLSFLFSHLSIRNLVRSLKNHIKQRIKRSLPIELVAAIQQRRIDQMKWYRRSAIRPDFAQRLHLIERILHDPDLLPPRTPRELQSWCIGPGRYIGGAYESELAAASGLEIRDPTVDARVLAFTLAVPDHIFMDPKTGIDRWLIRETMKNRLPDVVRLNRNRGRQAGDLVPRLRACADEVETSLNELEHGPASAYVDVTYMRQVWQMIQTENTNEAFNKSITVLTRGIMGGLFVNKFYD